MAKASPQQNVFEGELSPLAQYRTDLDRYGRGMRYMRNGVACRTGPYIGRSGTYFEQRIRKYGENSILVPFVYNEDETLVMEFSGTTLRFHYEYDGCASHREYAATSIVTTSPPKITFPNHDWSVGEYVVLSGFAGSRGVNNVIAKITAISGDDVTFGDGDITLAGATGALSGDEEGAVVYEVTTPYDEADLPLLRAVQVLNTVYLFCDKADGSGGYRTQVLQRYDTYDWRISELEFKDGPYLDINTTATFFKPLSKGTWIPDMTGNTAPSGTAAASSEVSGHSAYKAFDGDIDSYWEGKTSQEGWLSYAFENGFSNALPDFTSNTTSGMTTSASSNSTDAWKAADRDAHTDWRSSSDVPQWWKVDLGSAHTVNEYKLRASKNKEEFSPRDWTLQGSNDNTNWTTVDTRTDVDWKSGEARHLSVGSPGSYRYYRIYCTKVNRKTVTTIVKASGSKKGKKGHVKRKTVTTKTDPRFALSEVKMSYTAGTPRVVDGYTIYLGRYNKGKKVKDHAPKTWTFEGYDGVNWEVLDSRQDYTDWGDYRSDYFELQNEEAYLKYRINIKEVQKEGDVTPRIGKLVMSSPDAPAITIQASSKYGINDNLGFQSTDVGRNIRLQDADNLWRWATISSVTDETTIGLDIPSKDPLVLDNKIKFWRLGIFSDTTGWPTCGVVHEDRLWVSGALAFPDHVCGSRTGRYFNFVQTSARGVVQDDHAIVTRCNSKYMSRVAWLKSSEEALMIGSGLEEFILTTPVDEALTARNVKIRKTTERGSAVHEPVVAANHVLMISKSGRALYDYSWSPGNAEIAGAYSAPMISVLGPHLLYPPVVQVVYQEEPHGVMWGRREDGSVVAMTYNPENGIFGGHRHDFGVTASLDGAVIKWMCVVPSPTDRQDSLWMVVERVIDGNTVQYIERMGRFWDFSDTLEEDGIHVDCALRYLDDGATSTVYGLWPLEGESVKVLADNVVHTLTVTNGAVTLPEAAERIIVGLKMVREGEIVAPDAGAEDGTARGKSKRPHSAVLALWETWGGQVGRLNEDTQTVEYTDIVYPGTAVGDLGTVTLYTGETDVTVLPFGYGKLGTVRFRQEDPFPFNVAAIYPQLVVSDDR